LLIHQFLLGYPSAWSFLKNIHKATTDNNIIMYEFIKIFFPNQK
jgi:hypothetical protein